MLGLEFMLQSMGFDIEEFKKSILGMQAHFAAYAKDMQALRAAQEANNTSLTLLHRKIDALLLSEQFKDDADPETSKNAIANAGTKALTHG